MERSTHWPILPQTIMKTGNTSNEVSAKGFLDTKTVPSTTKKKKSLTGRKVSNADHWISFAGQAMPINQSDTAQYTKGRYRYWRHRHFTSCLYGRGMAALASRQMTTCGVPNRRIPMVDREPEVQFTRWSPDGFFCLKNQKFNNDKLQNEIII